MNPRTRLDVEPPPARDASRRLSRCLAGLAAAALLIPMAASGSAAATNGAAGPSAGTTEAVTGAVDEVNLPSGAKAFVYVPDGIELVAWTTPVLLVLGDEDFTAASAREMAEASDLAADAKGDNAVITFANSLADEWGAADVATFDQIINRLYSERPSPAKWSGGRVTGSGEYPVTYQGYDHRISIVAEGGAADFVSTYLVDDTLHLSLNPANVDWLPADVMLFNPTAVPTASYREWPAIVINGSAEVNSRYASLNPHGRLFVGSSPVTDGFDLSVISDRYEQWTGVRRQQLGTVKAGQGPESNNVVWDIPDYEALGVAPRQVDLTLSSGRNAMYLAYVPETLDLGVEGSIPLVMLFHGSGERAEWISLLTGWPELAAKEGFIVVSVDDHLGQRTPGNLTTAQIVELMDDVFAKYPSIDRTRVYSTGFSMGSGRSINLGTQRPDLFAAIAPMHTTVNPSSTMDDLVIPTIYFAGENDTFPSSLPRHTSANYTGTLNNADRTINQLYKMNDIRGGEYTFDTTAGNQFWGIDFDEVDVIPAQTGTSVVTVNSLKSADGNVYTKLVNTSRLDHSTFADDTPIAWEFLKQFSRNADGTVAVTPSSGVTVVVDVPEVQGALTLSVAGDAVTLDGPTTSIERLRFDAELPAVTVTDSRNATQAGDSGWAVSGQASAFASGSNRLPAGFLAWGPRSYGAARDGVVFGPAVAGTLDGGPGLAVPATLVSAPAQARRGVASATADLRLEVPFDTEQGHYTSQLTVSLFPVD